MSSPRLLLILAPAEQSPGRELRELVNWDGDAIPFFGLDVDAWRAGGDGFLGFTESLGGGVHLQSYSLLGRGQKAVAEMLSHLTNLKDTRS